MRTANQGAPANYAITGTGRSPAVSRARRPVLSRPSTSTPTPQPTMIHQPTWLAAAKSSAVGPRTPETTAAPITATPSEPPTCRLVDATAAATPACARGMPDTAVLVIGALTIANPNPNTT